MASYNIVLYPLTIKIGDDSDSHISSIKNTVNVHTDDQWKKMIKEFNETVKEYDDYGLEVTDVKRFKNEFIRCTVNVIDEEKFKNWEEKHNLSGVFASFIDHDLRSGGYPSFYKDNNKGGKYISSFIVVETKLKK
jgi:hypothetical protein